MVEAGFDPYASADRRDPKNAAEYLRRKGPGHD